jgi:hypothetical protein
LCDEAEEEIKSEMSRMTNEVAVELKSNGLNGELRYFTGRGGGPLGQIKKMCKFPISIKPHEHALVEKEKGGGWFCDGCRQNNAEINRYRCGSGCDFDYCKECKDTSENVKEMTEEERAPKMIVFELSKQKFYKPKEGGERVTKENMVRFLTEFTNGELEGIDM